MKEFEKPRKIFLSKENKFIFINLPKNASTSIEGAIKRYCHKLKKLPSKHCSYRYYNEVFYIKDYTTFAVIRNPWSRLVSFYLDLKFRLKSIPEEIPFKTWLYTRFEISPYYDNDLILGQQIAWLNENSDNNKDIKVQHILKFENLKKEWRTFSRIINVPRSLQKINKSTKYNYQEFYDNESKKYVHKEYQDDIELFGYRF